MTRKHAQAGGKGQVVQEGHGRTPGGGRWKLPVFTHSTGMSSLNACCTGGLGLVLGAQRE